MPKACANCVLLVDDDPSIHDLLSTQLTEQGFQIIHAEDGIDALVKLRDRLPKVIISDLEMPRMSGFEFIAVVRRRFPGIPVVALSGSILREFSEEIEPDCWFEKSMLPHPELLHAVSYLARKTPEHIDLPQRVSSPIRIRSGGADHVLLTCTDCLRSFAVANAPENRMAEQKAVCPNCHACVSFLIESSEPQEPLQTGPP